MPTVSEATELVTLTGGLVVPLPVLEVLWRLELRGARFGLDGETVTVSPRGLVSDDDRAVIQNYRSDVIAVLRYQANDDHLFRS
jgi:hypothetical protein